MSRKRKEEEVKKGAPEWMNTYVDMVTLLLTFFIMLFSMSTIEEQKFAELIKSVQGALGDFKGSIGINYQGEGTTPSKMIADGAEVKPDFEQVTDTLNRLKPEQEEGNIAQEHQDMEKVHEQVKAYVENNNLGEVVSIIKESRGLLIRFNDNVLFDSGKADLKDHAKSILSDMAKILSEMNKNIRVEGHTDNRPINTPQFPSNWELSTQRAVNVLKYFIEVKSFAPKRLSAVGYGEYHPVADNSEDGGRQKNRRVDIVILREYYAEDVSQ